MNLTDAMPWLRLSRAGPRLLVAIACALLLAQWLAIEATPRAVAGSEPQPAFAEMIPAQFADWREVATTIIQTATQHHDAAEPDAQVLPYDDAIERTYQNAQGERVMLALARVQSQRQEIKIHRQELCYGGQGFDILSARAARLPLAGLGGPEIEQRQFLARSAERIEAVSYWIRVGALYSTSAVQTRLYLIREGLRGQIPDGVLVRASQVITREQDAERSYSLQQQFLRSLWAALPEASRRVLAH